MIGPNRVGMSSTTVLLWTALRRRGLSSVASVVSKVAGNPGGKRLKTFSVYRWVSLHVAMWPLMKELRVESRHAREEAVAANIPG